MTKTLGARPRDAKAVAEVTNAAIVRHRMREPPPLSCRAGQRPRRSPRLVGF
jgi:hypothetical protein